MSETYLGNPLLKKANVPIHFTQEQIEEYLKCSEDVVYFTENYVKIINVDRGLIKFDMYPYQRKMLETFAKDRFIIARCPRQSGKTTSVTSYLLWRILFHNDQNIGILANKGRLANEILAKIQLAYENLPKWLQQGVTTWNKGNIEIENGSKVLAAATSSSAIRGGSYNSLLLDEFAFVPGNIAENFFASVYPTISSGKTTQIIIVSTPNGMNHYYKMWTDAVEKRNTYVPIDVHWREIPGRDDKWREETIRNTSEHQFRAEFETEFLGSSNTLISSSKLQSLAFLTPTKDKSDLDIYREPIEDKIYVITVDVSHGVGQDYSAFSVIDVSEVPYRIVAKYRNNTVPPILYPDVIYRTAIKYNNAYVMVETNDTGQQVAEALHHDLEYDAVLTTAVKNRAGQKINAGHLKKSTFGVRMTKQIKQVGCSNLKEMIEYNKLIIEDFDIIEELGSFVAKGSSYEAEEGHHDDLVMTLVIFSWMVRQPFFKDLTSTDIRKKFIEDLQFEVSDDVMPAGYIDDGGLIENIDAIGVEKDFKI